VLFLLNQFGASNTLDISIKKRGYAPLGGGIVKIS
jgi:RNA 3'-terminal phosphate cyclase